MPLFEAAYAEQSGRSAQLYPGVVAGLARFRAGGVKLACVTNKSRRYTIELLDRTQLTIRFDSILCGDDLTERKPHPMPFTVAAQRLGIAPARALVIGDSINDIAAGRAAGCTVFAVPYGYREGATVESLGADRVVGTLDEAAQICLNAVS